jgi:hypothetical protein
MLIKATRIILRTLDFTSPADCSSGGGASAIFEFELGKVSRSVLRDLNQLSAFSNAVYATQPYFSIPRQGCNPQFRGYIYLT